MPLLRHTSSPCKPVHLVLAKDRVRSIKSGAPWLFADAFDPGSLQPAPPGSLALVKNANGDILAKGIYHPGSQLAFRVMAQRERLDEELVEARLRRALELRRRLFPGSAAAPGGGAAAAPTTGFRLLNGEGDCLPGLVVDVYGEVAVVKLDGEGPTGFYDAPGVALWLKAALPRLRCVYERVKSREGARGRVLWGQAPSAPVEFLENGLRFTADVVQGQKTGFFLDMRDNRARLQPHHTGCRVLNLFGFTGGFSVYAGAAGAEQVTTVDIAAPACAAAQAHWALNDLDPSRHRAVAADCFAFLEDARSGREQWDVVVVDPPSFAPNKLAVDKASAAYTAVFAAAAGVTARGGILALGSCSSHIPTPLFSQLCQQALQKGRRQAMCLGAHGQPPDHPWPAAGEELRYLKFHVYSCD